MYINRYASDTVINGKILGTNGSIRRIREGISNGVITTSELVLQESARLDTIAQKAYGDGKIGRAHV